MAAFSKVMGWEPHRAGSVIDGYGDNDVDGNEGTMPLVAKNNRGGRRPPIEAARVPR